MELKTFSLKDKTALITGGGGFLGYQHALSLLESGANIVLSDISEENLTAAVKNLEKSFPKNKVFKIKTDVSSIDSVKDTQKILSEKEIFIDILVNNAAIDPKVSDQLNLESSSRLENFDIDEWNKQISVGLTGAFNCIKIFGYLMATSEKKGVILNIASDLSIIAPDQRLYLKTDLEEEFQQVKPVTYSVIKSGLIGLTKYVSTYWADKNVRCNALSPGGIFNNQPEEFVSRISKLIPMERMAYKEEYRGAVQFLCSEASSYMTGQNVVMDGGRSVW